MARPANAKITDWISFFDAVDQVRKTRNFTPLKKLLAKSRRTREKAVINATARFLSNELKLAPPWWAHHNLFLQRPYFVSGIENLKAIALLESDVEFRKNNIFVLGNFLNRT